MCAAPLGRRGLSVTVVASNAETLRALDSYLHRAGVAANGTRMVDRVLEMTAPSSAAVILFPDDYPKEAVAIALGALQRERPDVLAVIVSQEPWRFEQLTGAGSSQHPAPLVIPKPAWAWTILDAVRARLDSDEGAAESSGRRDRDWRPSR
jgi:hypothetical protein